MMTQNRLRHVSRLFSTISRLHLGHGPPSVRQRAMRFSNSALLGLAAQTPLNSLVQPATNTTTATMRRINHDFKLKEGKHILSPKNMLELPRPGAGTVNEAGDLVLVPVSKYSFEESKYVVHTPCQIAADRDAYKEPQVFLHRICRLSHFPV
jgi:hypothetical protein